MGYDSRYNGWTNHSTWLAAMWIDNDQYLQEEIQSMDRDRAATYLEEQFSVEHSGVQNGLFCDLLTHALADVNWEEIAGHHVEEEEEV